MANSGYYPAPGAQNPGGYVRTGPNYAKYGEQPGWVYSSRDDKYYRSPESQEALRKQEEEQGLRAKTPSKPGLGEAILPVAATVGAIELGKGLGSGTVDKFGNLIETGSFSGKPKPIIPTEGTAPPATNQGLLAGSNSNSFQGGVPPEANFPTSGTDSAKLPNLETTSGELAPVTETGPVTMPDGTPGHAMSDGGQVGDNGSVVTPQGATFSAGTLRTVQGVGGAAQAYNGYKQWQNGQKLAGAANVAGGAFNTYSAISGSGGSYVPYVGAGVAAAQIGQNMMNTEGNSEDRAAASQTEGMKAVLPFLGPYGIAAYAVISGLDAVSGGKFSSTWTKGNNKLNKFNRKIDFGLQHAIDSRLFHQSTRGLAKEHSGQLMQASDDPAYQAYVAGMREQYNEDPVDPTKPFAGKYATWDDYKKGGLEAADLTGVYGNIKTYGPEWATLTQEQRQAVTQANINSGLYASKMGEVNITDEAKAKENFANVMKGFQAGTKQNQGLLTANTASPTAPGGIQPVPRMPAPPNGTGQTGLLSAAGPAVMQNPNFTTNGPQTYVPPRSSTSSPGIGLDGRPLPQRNRGLLAGAEL